MIKVVPDANIILSSMLSSQGVPRQLINLALAKKIVMYGSAETYAEFRRKIHMSKFKKYLDRQIFTPEKLELDYRTFINIVEPGPELADLKVVEKDPDDDMYFRVAKASGARVIITGDGAVLEVKKYDGIVVTSVGRFVAKISLL